jgi:hypothetical protein
MKRPREEEPVPNVTIELSPTQSERLREQAARLGVRPEELGLAAILDLLDHPSPEFQETAERVLRRNAELYRRLS